MAKKRIALLLFFLVLGGGIVLGIFWWSNWRFIEHTDDAYVQADVTNISAKVSGHVVALPIYDNQLIHAGDLLLQIDDRDYQTRVDATKAMLEAAKAAVSVLDARYEQQNAIIDQAIAQHAAAHAERIRSDKDLARSRSLVATSAASRQELDNRQADLDKAKAQEASAEAQLTQARHQQVILRAEKSQALATVQETQAALEAALLDLEHTRILAPIDGRIGNRSARLGQYVRQGAALLAIVPTENVWIDANFKETQIGVMHPGQRASITVDSFPGQTIDGVVDSLSPASGAVFSLLPPENATGNFTKVVQRIPVRIIPTPDNPLKGKLRPGMSVTIRIDTRSPPSDQGQASLINPESYGRSDTNR